MVLSIDFHITLPPAMLQEVIDKAEGAEAAKEEKSELEELKRLLPEIAEKIEDAKESQRTAAAASEAIHQTLVSCIRAIMQMHEACYPLFSALQWLMTNLISACIIFYEYGTALTTQKKKKKKWRSSWACGSFRMQRQWLKRQ